MKKRTPVVAGATLLTSTTGVRRCTQMTIRDRSKLRRVVVGLQPGDIIDLRLAGTRRRETVPIDAVYALAIKMRVAAEKSAKRKLQKGLK